METSTVSITIEDGVLALKSADHVEEQQVTLPSRRSLSISTCELAASSQCVLFQNLRKKKTMNFTFDDNYSEDPWDFQSNIVNQHRYSQQDLVSSSPVGLKTSSLEQIVISPLLALDSEMYRICWCSEENIGSSSRRIESFLEMHCQYPNNVVVMKKYLARSKECFHSKAKLPSEFLVSSKNISLLHECVQLTENLSFPVQDTHHQVPAFGVNSANIKKSAEKRHQPHVHSPNFKSQFYLTLS
ncbi:unnamed protein product [Thelazia callipaeda]|uniref:ELM2 domain-containing protein n=1 Tax=Thelazia callipaeda TaxID=103827 RepID=A0A0N5D1E3_THECL|nr:unnamed protein product [Thelazia callipaeda]